MRWLGALIVSALLASPASAGVFKSRGSGGKPASAKKADKPAAAPVKKAAAPAKKPVATRAPAKKKKSPVASKGRPTDLTPDAKKPSDVVITEAEDDVIIRDIDD